ncbi:MAG: hypothetical protein K5662_04200 [Lachnospiraceae bacterium]|nr:hypothetical protein [Lachnospiraceae bacterium]
MSGRAKVILVVLIVLYVVSPFDIHPLPIDDVIVIFLGALAQKLLENKRLPDKDIVK